MNYSQGAPPPPPPPPAAGPAGATPWYRKPWPLFLLGIVVAAAVAIPVLVIVLGGDDGGTAAGSSTTTTATTTTEATATTEATTTTAATTTEATTTTAATTTTSMPSPCGDPTLDALYQQCAAEDMQACDDLFWQSPAGSECEEFGDTCGGTTSGGEVCAGSGSVESELDYMLPAVFAEDVDLAIGFTPDPTGWAMQAGGPVDADDLNEPTCHGYTTAAPSVEVNYSGGTSALLRFYFVADNAGDDTVLIVSDAYGNWVCNDDYDFDAGILDPLVDISEAVEGTYDIWVASYDEGQLIPGTLYVTEVPDHHP